MSQPTRPRWPSANDAWLILLENILRDGEEQSPRGKLTKELIGHRCHFDMSRPIVTIAQRKLGYKFLAAEAWWILSGSNRVDEIAPYSKQISSFSDDGLTFRGAYGPKIQDQIPWVAEQLKNDPNTRQAVLTIWRERPGPSRDYPCTLSLQYLLRRHDGQLYLHCMMNMRSSDAWMGAVYDWFNGAMETAFLIAYMRTAYPETFNEEIHLGKLTFTAGSQHLYDDHFDAAKNCTFDDDVAFDYAPINPELYQSDPYKFLAHVKSLADRDPADSPFTVITGVKDRPHDEELLRKLQGKRDTYFYPQGYLGELYELRGAEKKTGFDAHVDPRGLGVKTSA